MSWINVKKTYKDLPPFLMSDFNHFCGEKHHYSPQNMRRIICIQPLPTHLLVDFQKADHQFQKNILPSQKNSYISIIIPIKQYF